MAPRGQRVAALLLAALAGAAVMVVELGVARILTPVFGGSIAVWALVIATTMLALAAGYAFGGHRADVTGGMVVARRAAALGALLCAAIPLVRRPLIEATVGLSTLTGAAIAAVVLIAPPLFFLSQVSPALIRGLSSSDTGHVGGTAGGVYAVSTLGSLVGTLAAVWILLYAPLTAAFAGMALLFAAITGVTLTIGVVGHSEDPRAWEAPRSGVRAAFTDVLQDRPFWLFVTVVTLLTFTTSVYTLATPFWCKYTLNAGPRAPSLVFATVFVVAIASVLPWNRCVPP